MEGELEISCTYAVSACSSMLSLTVEVLVRETAGYNRKQWEDFTLVIKCELIFLFRIFGNSSAC